MSIYITATEPQVCVLVLSLPNMSLRIVFLSSSYCSGLIPPFPEGNANGQVDLYTQFEGEFVFLAIEFPMN